MKTKDLIKEYTDIKYDLQLPSFEDIPDLTINRYRSRKPPIVLDQQLTVSNFNVSKWDTLWTDLCKLNDPIQKPGTFEEL